MYVVHEQIFHQSRGYSFKPVTSRPRSAQECNEIKETLEKRFREDELDTRKDWDSLYLPGPFRAKLKHIGNRIRERLFVVRRVW